MRRFITCSVLVLILLCIAAVIVNNLPPVQERVVNKLQELREQVKYALDPPEQAVFVPQPTVETPVSFVEFDAPTPSPTTTASATPPGPTVTLPPPPTAAFTPTPLPPQALLTGITLAYESWYNSGPANLAMALSFWGWKGDQRESAAFMKPNPRDKNVMPWEMQAFVEQNTGLGVVVRVGGTIDLIKAFVAAGFPVLVEKGFEGPRVDGWMGHYEVINGYDDSQGRFTVQDSYDGPDIKIPYENMESAWRAFNHLYVVIYPPERQAEVASILGPQIEENINYQYAADKAFAETKALKGRDLYFAWFNRGTTLMYLKDYAQASTAYDAAFANYDQIPEKERPWRMLWYQTGPYFAYFFSQRYQDVINLATETLNNATEPAIEESFYWRGRARAALGDSEGAIKDFEDSLKWHPDFGPSLEQLQLLGVQP